MPINYVAPGPLQQIMSNSRSSGGGGGGITYGPDRTSQFQNELALAGLQGSIHAGIEREQIAGQLNQQQAHAESQAWLFNQEMTLKDQARLQQMKQAVSAVTADPTLTEEEKQRGITMLRSGIDPMDMRLKKQQMEALAEQRKAHAQLFAEQAQQRDNALSFQRAEMDGKLAYWVPPKYKEQLAEMMQVAYPMIPSGSPEYDAKLTMLADQNGWTEPYTKNSKGEVVFRNQVKGHAAGGGGEQAPSTGRGGTELDAAHIKGSFHDAMKLVTGMSKEIGDDGKPKHPELQTTEGRIAEANKIADATEQRVSDHFKASDPKQKSAQERQAVTTGLDMKMQEYQGRADLPPQLRGQAISAMQSLKKMVQMFGPISSMKGDIKTRAENLQAFLNQLPAAPPLATAKATDQPEQPSPRMLGGLINADSLVGQAIQGAQGLGSPIGGGN